MALAVVQLSRVFEDNGVQLADPAPGLGIQEAVRILASTGRPHLLTCEIRGPVQRDNQVVYTLHRAVGTKGLLAAMTTKHVRKRVQTRLAARAAMESYESDSSKQQVSEKGVGELVSRLGQPSDGEDRVALPSSVIPWTC